MADNYVNFDLSEINEFVSKLERAAKGDFKKELAVWMQGLGAEFLRIVEDEIIRLKVMDTRLLLASFHEGGDGNVWEISDGGLTLEVGTNVKYASYVNDGHWLNPEGVAHRFVPGDVVLGADGKIIKFTYNPDAKTGMALKQKWIEGKHYWESAVRIFEKMFPGILEAKMQGWLDKYFE